MAANEQQYCLKWNNHRSTLFSVFDTLLEEESLVDVTLSAEGQFLRAHRVILSACSPYFRNLFKSHYLNDKHPVVFIKDMEFENLKSLVEYMYKGEANVPQHMLQAFIKDAESLQIRGLAECASKQFDSEMNSASPSRSQQATPTHAPNNKKSSGKNNAASALGPTGILAARLAKMSDQVPPPISNLFGDFSPEGFQGMLARNPAFLAAAATSTPLGLPPPMKKSRKSAEPRPRGGSPTKDKKKTANSAKSLVPASTNNNYDDGEEGGLKIDEDADPGKENLENKMENSEDNIAEVDGSNGVSEEEEEPSMPGPGGDLAEAAGEIYNPWTGGKLQLGNEDNDDNSAQDDTGLSWGGSAISHLGTDFSSEATSAISQSVITPTSTPGSASAAASRSSVPRLKRLNNAQQHNVYTLCQTSDGAMKFRCTECNRCFNLKCTLLRHVRHQHQGRFVPHPCGQCGQVFKRTDHLKVHMRKIHKMTSASRSNRGASAAASAEPGQAGQQAALVAAAVASMANTQPLALTKEEPEQK